MKLTVQIQVVPDKVQDAQLHRTVERFNEAANWVAGELFAQGVTNKRLAQKLVYRELRDRFELTAQTAILVIHRVCEAYKRDKDKRPKFRKHAAITYDARVMRFIGLDKVNLWTLAGRLVIPILIGKYQAEQFTHTKGQADLVLRHDGKWFLLVAVDVPDAAPIPATNFMGVDFGVVNIAMTEDGDKFSGETSDATRRHYGQRRKALGRAAGAQRRAGKRPKNIRRATKRTKAKEARFRKHENHCIAKKIVETSKGTDRGIGLEDLEGIRDRVSARGGEQRNRLSGWAFFQASDLRGVQGRAGGCARRGGGPSQYQPDLPRVRPLRESQPQEPVGIRVSRVWTLFACRPRRGSDHRVQGQGVRNGA